MLSGDGCGRPLQRGRRASSSPPQPLDVPSAALQLSRGPTGCHADPGRPQFTDRMQPHLILVSKVRTVPSCFCVCLCFVGRVNRASRTF